MHISVISLLCSKRSASSYCIVCRIKLKLLNLAFKVLYYLVLNHLPRFCFKRNLKTLEKQQTRKRMKLPQFGKE